jgi:hypothetical protein
MRFEEFSFGSIRIDGVTYDRDVVIDRGEVRKRKKKPSKKFRDAFGHTPLSVEEKIPWKCRRLVVGTGTGALPVMEEVKREAKRRNIELLIVPTARAIEVLEQRPDDSNAVLHVTCGEERAEIYLRRIVALTGATQMGEGYVLNVGKTRFHVRPRY